MLLRELGLREPPMAILRWPAANRVAVPYDGNGASKDTIYRGQRRPPAEGYGTVVARDDATSSFNLSIEGAWMRLGIWWLEAAARGGPKTLPIVNAEPEFEASRDQLEQLDQRLQQAAERASEDQRPDLVAEYRRLADLKAMIEPEAAAVAVPEA